MIVKKKQAGGSKRQQQVADKILVILSKCLRQNISDQRLHHATFVAVEVSADLKYAFVYYTLLCDPELQPAIAKALQHAAGYFRSAIASNSNLRFTPRLVFRFDQHTHSSMHLARLLDQLPVAEEEAVTDESA